MDMMLMLIVLAIIYFVSLALLFVYREKINAKIGNAVFIALDAICYFLWNVGMYQSGWFDDIYYMLANISPMIFTVIPLTYVLGKRAKNYIFSTVAYLWFGMFVALFASPINEYLSRGGAQASLAYTAEALCHLVVSLFGIYLIITKQVELDLSGWRKALTFLYGAILLGVILNYVFHLGNFGMNPYGGYGIYFIDIFRSYEATLLAYVAGVAIVVTLGMQIGILHDKWSKKAFNDMMEQTD